MRSVSIVLLLVMVAVARAAPTLDKPHYDVSNAHALFEDFIKDYNRHYKDDADKEVHYRAFVKSLKTINQLNEDTNNTATFAVNKFADYTEDEMKKMFGLLNN